MVDASFSFFSQFCHAFEIESRARRGPGGARRWKRDRRGPKRWRPRRRRAVAGGGEEGEAGVRKISESAVSGARYSVADGRSTRPTRAPTTQLLAARTTSRGQQVSQAGPTFQRQLWAISRALGPGQGAPQRAKQFARIEPPVRRLRYTRFLLPLLTLPLSVGPFFSSSFFSIPLTPPLSPSLSLFRFFAPSLLSNFFFQLHRRPDRYRCRRDAKLWLLAWFHPQIWRPLDAATWFFFFCSSSSSSFLSAAPRHLILIYRISPRRAFYNPFAVVAVWLYLPPSRCRFYGAFCAFPR